MAERVIALDVSPDMLRKQLTIIGSWTTGNGVFLIEEYLRLVR